MRKFRLLSEYAGSWLRHCWRLPIFLMLIWASPVAAQLGCSSLTVTWINYEPCKYRVSIVNASECTPSLRLVLDSGQFASWSANTAGGWSGQQIAPNEIQLSHNTGLVPIGTSFPIIFSLQPGVNVTAALLWDFTCGLGESCFDEEQITSCPDPGNGSIVGVKYRECDGKPYTNQAIVPGWPIQLLNIDGQVIAEEVTGTDGVYAFYDLSAGVYTVKEGSLAGWTPNVPASGMAIANLDPSENTVINFGNCLACTCNTSATATISTNGSNFVVKCDQVTQPVFACPTTSPVMVTGNFGCVNASGNACQPPAPIDWKLIGPGGVIITQNTITTGAPWTLTFPAAQLLGSGQYNLYMTTLCPGQTDSCKCEIEWYQECAAPCTCGPNSFNLEVRYGGAQNQPVQCEQTITLSPSTAFYPSFQCAGGNCNPASTVDWTLTGPGFSQTMTGVIPTPAFSIPYLLPGGGLTAPGNYTLVMTGHCGTQTCTCKVYFCLPPPPISVRDSSVCRTDLQAYIPLENCPALTCGVMQVRWFLKTCSAANFPTTPYQVSSGPGCADLLLLPYQYPTESCVQVYAEVTLNGACCTTQFISNEATIHLCNPISCSITNPNPPQGFCQCGTPQSLTVTPGGANCNFTFEWYFKGNLVGSSSTYQPPQICFEGGPNDCYTDHVFTAIIKGICAPTTCTTTIRVYNDNAPTGTINMVPNELQPFCPGEDARLVYTDKCAGEPPKWNWFISHIDPSPSFPADYTPIPNSGNMNSVFYTNKLWQTTWYLVEKKNGACPADQVAYRIEVKNSLVINDFKATPDPCMENPVALWVDFTPSPIAGAGCQYVVEWYKDGNLIHTSTSLVSPVSYTYFGTGSAAGVYYAIVKDNCCPQAEKTFPIILNPACVPVIAGPCFKCDTITPINIMGEMVLPPQDPCPAGVTCTYQWYKKDFPTPTTPNWVPLTGQNGQTLTITKGGHYKFESSCDYGFGPCIKSDSITIIQCESTGMGCQILAEKDISVATDFSISLQPNPTAGNVTVLFQSSTMKKGRVDIVDITGRVWASEWVPGGQSAHTLSLGHLPEGIYFTRVFESNVLIWSGKIVRSK